MRYSSRFKWYFIPLFIILVALIVSWLVMLLWNSVIPDLFGLKTINYSQALLLFLLTRILFGGSLWHNHGARPSAWYRHYQKMTPEERQHWEERVRDMHRGRRFHGHFREEHFSNSEENQSKEDDKQ